MKNLHLFILALIPMTSFAIDPDRIRYPANEYQQPPEYAERAEQPEKTLTLEEEELRDRAREEEAPLQAPYAEQQAPKQSTYTPPPFEDPRHMTYDPRELETGNGERDLGRGLPNHAQPPRGLTPQDKSRPYQQPGYPAD